MLCMSKKVRTFSWFKFVRLLSLKSIAESPKPRQVDEELINLDDDDNGWDDNDDWGDIDDGIHILKADA
jgi:hypothetical protein